MDTFSTLTGIALLWGIAAATPGPNFMITARSSVGRNRRSALWVVGGICTGTTLWGMGGFFGVALLFATVPLLYGTLKLMGGGYLVWLGFRLLKAGSAGDGIYGARPTGSSEPLAAFRSGFLTTIANPKTAAFVTSLFAAAMPPDAPAWFGLLSVALMVAISAIWYSLVACLFSIGPVRTRYRKVRVWIDRLAGALFVGLGVQLAVGD